MGGNSGGSSGVPPESFDQWVNAAVTAATAAQSIASMFGLLESAQAQAQAGPTLDQVLKQALQKVRTDALADYKAAFPSADPNSDVDSGVIIDYTPAGADYGRAVVLLKTNFNNWGIPITDDQALKLVESIAEQVDANVGAVSSIHGTFDLNMNESVNWVFRAGTFAQDDAGTQALVYGFTGALVVG